MASPTAGGRVGGGSPLVLLHGIGGTWRVWLPVLGPLGREHDVLALTLPGHCGAQVLAPGVAPTVRSLADALEEQLDRLDLYRPHVAGNSLGGWLALELARRGRARSVTALSPGGAWARRSDVERPIGQLRLGLRVLAALEGRLDLFMRLPRGRRLLLRQLAERGERIPADELRTMLRDFAACPVLLPLMQSVADGDQLGQVAPDDCPIRIAWAEQDRVFPRERFLEPMRARVPGAELSMLPGVGHVPMSDDPDLVARTILATTGRAEQASCGAAAGRGSRAVG